MLWNKNIIKFTSSYNGFTYKDYYFPLLRYGGKIRKIENLFNLEQDDSIEITYRQNGFRGMEREWNNDLAKAKLKMSQYKIEIDSSSVNLFNQFLIESKENKIKVILVYTPEYIDGQKFVENRNEIIKIYKDFAIKYNLLFLDYSNDDLCTKKELFYNSSHLNKKGADIFTRKLSSELKARTHNRVDGSAPVATFLGKATMQAIHIENFAKENAANYFDYVFELIKKIDQRLIDKSEKTSIYSSRRLRS